MTQHLSPNPQKLIESLDNLLLKVPGELEVLGLRERYCTATHLLSGLENVLRTLAKAMPGTSFTYHSSDDTGEAVSCPTPDLGPISTGTTPPTPVEIYEPLISF